MTNQAIDVEAEPTQALAVKPAGGVVDKALTADQIPNRPAITAAQAKVDAVAALTMTAYEKAATLNLTAEEAAKLQADFPDDAFQPGAAGKEHLIYIEHAYLRDRFNAVFGMGKWAIVPRNRWAEAFKTKPSRDWPDGQDGSRVYVEAMLVVRGCFVGEAVGAMEYYPHNASQNYGDAVEGAKTAAFRRCAKEFGVGLQAWKKEFCEGWWTRKRGSRNFNRQPAQNAPGPTAAARPSPQTARASTAAPSPTPAPAPPVKSPNVHMPTAKTRLWMISELESSKIETDRAIEYFEKIDQLIPGKEGLADLPLRFVPFDKAEMAMLITRMRQFLNGDPAEPAFAPHWEAEALPPKKSAAPATNAPTAKPTATPPEAAQNPEWFMDVIVSLPRKGMKRDDYLRNPDTIRSLYDIRHGNDEEANTARQRLFGLVQWKPEPREFKGKTYQPSDSDWNTYRAMQAFAEWFAQNHPDEKL